MVINFLSKCLVLIVSFKFPNSLSSFVIPHSDCNSLQVEAANHLVSPVISKLRKTRFFRIFKVSLDEICIYWDAQKSCSSPSCFVCPCEQDQIPQSWRNVNRNTKGDFLRWAENDHMWIAIPPEDKMAYIDLSLNPHQDTGYTGKSPRRVWEAIYGENCVNVDGSDLDSHCTEDQFFYRLISGMHSSVSAHIARKSNSRRGVRPDFSRYRSSLGRYPERINNLYFLYVFMARALSKAKIAIENSPYDTGELEGDVETLNLMKQLLNLPVMARLNNSFSEKSLFNGNFFDPKIDEYKKAFRNISLILNCVECEKCQLYGKLQILGIGTALKIMFSKNANSCFNPSFFQRNEITALVMTFSEFSDSIRYVVEFMEMERRHFFAGISILMSLCALSLYVLFRYLNFRMKLIS